MQILKRILQFFKNKFVILIVILIAGSFLYINYLAPEKDIAEQIYIVSRGDIVQSVLLTGAVEAVQHADLSFGVSGKINSIAFKVGDVVEEGDTLAMLDRDILEADLLKANGDVQSARANITVAEASVRKARANIYLVKAQTRGDDSSLDSAAEKLQNTKDDQEVLVENARQSLLKNDIQSYPVVTVNSLPPFILTGSYTGGTEGKYSFRTYISSQSNIGYSIDFYGIESGTVHFKGFDSPEALGERGLFISFPSTGSGLNYNNSIWEIPIPNNRSATYQSKISAFDTAKTNAILAVSNEENSLEKLQAEEEQGDISLNTAEEDQALAALEEAEGNLAQAQGSLSQARASVRRVEAQLEDSKIVAPFTGTIARLKFTVGEIVSASEIGMTLISDDNFQLSMNVPEIDIAKIALSDVALVTLDVYGNDAIWGGLITAIELIESEVDGVPVYETTISIVEPDSRIRVGMNARAEIVIEEKEGVTMIPSSYIITQSDTKTVRIRVDELTIEDRLIQTGLLGSNNFVEVLSGLSVDDRVIKPQK